eukprot:1011359_1
MWKQIGLLVVVFLTLGQAMEFGRPDNINRTADELELKNKIQTIFTEWQSARQNAWPDDEILGYPKQAMNFVTRRFGCEFGGLAIHVLDKYRGANLDGDDKYQDLLEATIIKMTVATQKEMDRVVSVILKDAKSMVQDRASHGLRFKVDHMIASRYHDVGVPMYKVRDKIEVFEKSLGSNIPSWMRKNLDVIYKDLKQQESLEDSRFRLFTPTAQTVFDMISEAAGPLREPSEPTDRTGRTETTTVPPVVNDKWFPLFFLLAIGLIIATILVGKFYFKMKSESRCYYQIRRFLK